MKPAFALDFRDDSIGLLHRSGSVWQVVGSVPIDAPDLVEALNYLRSTAVGLSPRGLATKLIIPNDQILYTTVHAPGADADTRHAQVVAALEGRTPYAVEDLQFDFHGDGPDILVAVIAKETLAEAEAFAVEHRFNPVSFVAVPDSADFGGEAWFGQTQHAAEILQPGEAVERDAVAVVTQARSFASAQPAPVAEPEPVPEPEPFVPEPEPFVPDPVPEPEPAPPIIEEPILPEPAAPPAPLEDPQPEYPLIEDPDQPDPEPVVWPDSAKATEAAPVAFAPDPEDNRALAAALGQTLSRPLPPTVRPAPPAPVARRVEPEAAEAPMALDVPSEDEGFEEAEELQGAGAIAAALSAQAEPDAPRASARVIDPQISDDLPAAPTKAALAAFASRRPAAAAPNPAPTLGAAARSLMRPGMAKPVAPPKLSRAPDPKAKPAAKVEKPAAAALRGLGGLVKSATKQATPAKPAERAAEGAEPALTPAAPTPAAAPALAKRPAAATATATARPPVRSDLNRGPGGFGNLRPAPVRGKPRYLGLFLTVVLLFLLAMVAAWSSYYLAGWNNAEDPAVLTAEADPAAVADPEAAFDPTDEMLADLQDPAEMTLGQTADQTAEQTTDLAAAPVPAPTPEATPLTEVASEPAASPNPTNGTQDEILLASLDAPPAAPDPLTLQLPAARGDPLPLAQPAPPPFGTVYQFTEAGLIRPTPEGIITPEGVLLLAGKPRLLPPIRPAAVTELAIATKSAAAGTALPAAAAVPDAAPPVTADLQPASPAMIGARPRLRPQDLVPPAPAEQGSLAPAPGSRVASLRPQPRPRIVLTAAEQAQQATAAASLAAQPAIDAAVAEAAASASVVSASSLAVAISRKPAPRPKDMSRAVEAAVAAAVRAPEPSQSAAVVAPEDDGEPELASAAPRIPTKASVAKQATFANVLNLSELNLIGIYGTQNSRYALVRQPNGRYKKISVGDSIDNGEVVAITASEVRYQKRGKLVALAMPKT